MSESYNPTWNDHFLPKEERRPHESAEAYQLRLMSKTDINFYNAKKNYDRPLYHKKFLSSSQDLGYNPYQE